MYSTVRWLENAFIVTLIKSKSLFFINYKHIWVILKGIHIHTYGIISEWETNNITKNLVSQKIQVIISYWEKLVTIAIKNIPMMFELY